jgi:GNAT superfamily N-acetyltransferase
VRAARPTDVPALMRFKLLLAESENGVHTVRATAADWLRDAFGPKAGFAALVAEAEYKRGLIGMATYSERTITGWIGPVVFLQDLFVEIAYRRNGVARALIARVAAHAKTIGSPMVELSVRADKAPLPAERISGAAALPHLRAGRAGARRTRRWRQGRSAARRIIQRPRHCEPMGAARRGRPDGKLREAIQRSAGRWIASSLRSSR